MNPLKKIFVLGILLTAFVSVNAQDVIFLKDGKQTEGKVLEIGLYEITYQKSVENDGPLVTLRKSDVLRIKFSDGTEEVFLPDPMSVNANNASLDKTRAIKFAFFSPLFAKLEFGYEQVLQPGINLDFRVAAIGPNLSQTTFDRNPRGFFIAGGPKFWLGSNFVMEGMRHAHPLAGSYIKFEAAYSRFRRDETVAVVTGGGTSIPTFTTVDGHVDYNGGALNMIYGKQMILGKTVTMDIYGGMGYGFASDKVSGNISSPAEADYFTPGYFSHLFAGPAFPITVTAGFRIGVLL